MAFPSTIGPYRPLTSPQPVGHRLLCHALHRETGEPAALFLVQDIEPALREQMRRRFHARRALQHPNIARLRDEGLLDPMPWYATELHEGRLLEQLAETSSVPQRSLRVGPASDTLVSINAPDFPAESTRLARSAPRPVGDDQVRRVLSLAFELCDALTSLHAQGFVHGSIGLDTVLLRDIDEAPVLLDPGLLEPVPATRGMLRLVPPELLLGEPVGGRTDLWLLGALLYELLSGRPPQPQDSAVPSLRTLVSGLPTGVQRLVHRMIDPDPAQRPAQPSDCALEIASYLGSDTILPPPRFTPALERAAVRAPLLKHLQEQLDQDGVRGVLVRTESDVDLSGVLDVLSTQAARQGQRVLWAKRCPWGLPLGAFASVLRGLELPVDVEGNPSAVPNGERHALLQAAQQAIQESPALLILEQAEALDDLSRALLRRLVQGTPGLRMVITTASPPHDLGAWSEPSLPEVAVAWLSEQEVEDLLRATLATRHPPEHLAQALHLRRQTEPWLIEQQLHHLVDTGELGRNEVGTWELRQGEPDGPVRLLPTPVLLHERLERLDDTARAVLGTVALLRTPVAVSWLPRLAGLDEKTTLVALDLLLRRRWLSRWPDDLVGLVHDRLEEPAAALLDEPARRAAHLRAAELFGRLTHLWSLGLAAHHLALAGEARASAHLFERLGLAAMRLSAPREALVCLRAAAREAEAAGALAPLERARLHRHLALALLETGASQQARHHAQLSVTALDLHPAAPGWSGLAGEALRQVLSPPAALPPEARHELAQGYVLLARLGHAPDEVPDQLLAAWRAIRHARALDHPPAAVAQAYSALGERLGALPLGPMSQRALERAVHTSRRVGDVRLEATGWLQQGQRHLHEARWAATEHALGRAISRAHDIGDESLALDARAHLGFAWFAQGELPRCLDLVGLLRAAPQEAPLAPWLALALEAEVALRQGRAAAALAALSPQLSLAPPPCRLRLQGLLAAALHQSGQRDPARLAARHVATLLPDLPPLLAASALFDALDPLDRHDPAAWTLLLALRRLARRARLLRPRLRLVEHLLGLAAAPLDDLLHDARTRELPYTTALVLRTLGHSRHDQRAEQALREAEQLLAWLRQSRPLAFPEQP